MNELINEIKPVVKDLVLSWLWDVNMVDESMSKVISNVSLKFLPELFGLVRTTMTKNGDKKTTKLASSLHHTGLLKTKSPLLVILQKPSSSACTLKSGVDDTIHSSEVFKRGSTYSTVSYSIM